MSMPGNQPPMSAADQYRLYKEGHPVIWFGQVYLTVYRRLFDPTTGWCDMFSNIVCISIGHLIAHRRTWQPTTPTDLPPPSASSGIARQVWYYSTRPRTSMYFAVCAQSHVVALSLRYLLPQAFKLLLDPAATGYLVRFVVTPSCWAGVVARIPCRRLPVLALKVLGTTVGCWLVSAVGTFADEDTLRMIQDPEEDERRNRYYNTPKGRKQCARVVQAITIVMYGIGYGIRRLVCTS
ncbi:hypothetical protein PG996_006348 [Apiospora saccharicola]|uniref:Uncharacterized protein n=1 Tax=Apiospora saccharicola TaxID=335842 RepID=A0ABR1VP20_9PEZI